MLPDSAIARFATAASLIALGAAARQLGGVTRADGGAILRLIFSVTLPAVLLTTFSTLPTNSADAPLIVGVSTVHAVLLLLASLTWDSAFRSGKEAAVLSGATIGVNLGTFATPFAFSIWGTPGLHSVMLFDLLNQIVLLIVTYLAFWARAAARSEGASAWALLPIVGKRLCNPCLIALYGAGALAVSGLPVPPAVAALAAPLCAANAPLALLALGIVLDLQLPRRAIADVAAVLGTRFSISLGLGAFVAATLQSALSTETLAVVLAAMTAPVPMLTLTYSQEFGCDLGLAAAIVNASIVLSFSILCALVHLSTAAPLALAPASAVAAIAMGVIGGAGRVAQRKFMTALAPTSTRAAAGPAACAARMPRAARARAAPRSSQLRALPRAATARLAVRLSARCSGTAPATRAPASAVRIMRRTCAQVLMRVRA